VHKVSVVIPTLNRADLVAKTIDRIESQTVNHDLYEVLVVDNSSTDHTQQVLAQKSATYPNLRIHFQSKRGAAPTRNVGIRKAVGDVVLFIDDDIFAEPDLIEVHLKHHSSNSNASIIGGVTAPWDDASDPFLRYLRDKRILNPYSIKCGPMDFSYYHTGNVSTPRKMLLNAGGFNEEFSVYGMEDIELGYRLEKLGCQMVSGTDAKALHQYTPTYRQFIERCEQAGFSLGKMLELHPELRHQFVENGKRTKLLKRIHSLYRMFSFLSDPFYRALIRWEAQIGTSPVTAILDQHYYWAIRYHFFLGYRQYTLNSGRRQAAEADFRLGRQRVPDLP
jgi:glycosyltransferase involved in cell wall biosynthesis